MSKLRLLLCVLACGLWSVGAESLVFASPPSFSNQTNAADINASHAPNYGDGFVAGGAVGDFNHDGWQDFFFASGGLQPDRLFINDGDGTFTNRASEWGIAGLHQSTGAAVADYDNDGLLDLFVSSFSGNRLYKNMGASFTNVASAAGVLTAAPYGGAFGDYDLDGDLDLAVVNWGSSTGNRLYRNNDDGTFTNVTTSSGVAGIVSGINGFTVRFCDMDGDRYPELLWVGDFGTTRYLRNNGNGTFSNITSSANVAWDGTEMGHTVQDFDRDGLFDWYITTINTNNLYRNLGNHQYQQIGDSVGVSFTGWGWGTVGVDFNHDMKFDIAATSQGTGQFMFMNNSASLPGPLQFSTVNAGFQSGVSGRGLANFDYDNDGDQDLIVFPHSGSVQLFRNDLAGSDINWIRIFLDTSSEDDLAPHGVGAVMTVTAGGVTQMGRLDAGSNYQSQSELAVHFGLETAAIIDTLTVAWPNGTSTVLTDVPVNQHLTISAGALGSQFVRGDVNDDGSVNVSDAITGLNHIFMGQLVECLQAVDANADESIDISDVIVLVDHLFTGGSPLPAPFPTCGDGDLQGPGCDVFVSCP